MCQEHREDEEEIQRLSIPRTRSLSRWAVEGFLGLWLISCDVLSQHPVQGQPHLVRNGYTAIHTYTLLLYNNGAAH